MGDYAKWIILIFVLLLFITFGIKNNQQVQLNYYFDFRTAELPLYGVVYTAMLLGIFLGMLIGIRNRLHLRRTVRDLEKEKKGLKGQVIEEKEKEEEVVVKAE